MIHEQQIDVSRWLNYSGSEINKFCDLIPSKSRRNADHGNWSKYSNSPYRLDNGMDRVTVNRRNELNRPSIEFLKELLWQSATDDLGVFAILDGYWCPKLYGELQKTRLSWCCLFEGPSIQSSVETSPFIVKLEKDHPFTDWLLSEGWGNGWGIYFRSPLQSAYNLFSSDSAARVKQKKDQFLFFSSDELFEEKNLTTYVLSRHFRKFTQVLREKDGNVISFRFFDPSVLRVYLLSCNSREAKDFFGKCRSFIVDGYSEQCTLQDYRYVYTFYLHNKDNRQVIEASLIDYLENKTVIYYDQELKGDSSSMEDEQKVLYPYKVMRSELTAQFSEFRFFLFSELAFQCVVGLSEALGVIPIFSELRRFVSVQLREAQNCGLLESRELIAFVRCAFLMGDGFQYRNPSAKALFEKNSAAPYYEFSIDLAGLGDKAFYEGGLA